MDTILTYVGKPKSDLDVFETMDWKFLFSVILSSQTTDVQVNKITPALFSAFPSLESFAHSDEELIRDKIKSIPFFRNKAKALKGTAQMLVARGGTIPDSMEELLLLPGVGRKVANVILTYIHGKPGIVVDTHVARVAGRLGWVDTTNPSKIESSLASFIPLHQQVEASNALVLFGRYTCTAKKPHCSSCPVDSCPSRKVS
jgi:endonuclease-3